MAQVDPNALVAAVPATIAAIAAWRSSRANRRLIDTNHGKRPGQYLEELHERQTLLMERFTLKDQADAEWRELHQAQDDAMARSIAKLVSHIEGTNPPS